jgi:hypothetical protein
MVPPREAGKSGNPQHQSSVKHRANDHVLDNWPPTATNAGNV